MLIKLLNMKDRERQNKRQRRQSTIDGILNLEVPVGVIQSRAPKALTLSAVLPHCFTSSDLSPHDLSFHSRGGEGRNSETKQKKKENMTERRKHGNKNSTVQSVEKGGRER